MLKKIKYDKTFLNKKFYHKKENKYNNVYGNNEKSVNVYVNKHLDEILNKIESIDKHTDGVDKDLLHIMEKNVYVPLNNKKEDVILCTDGVDKDLLHIMEKNVYVPLNNKKEDVILCTDGVDKDLFNVTENNNVSSNKKKTSSFKKEKK
jgi:hypothetical protein